MVVFIDYLFSIVVMTQLQNFIFATMKWHFLYQ